MKMPARAETIANISKQLQGKSVLLATGKEETYNAFEQQFLEQYPMVAEALLYLISVDPELSAEEARNTFTVNGHGNDVVVLYPNPAENVSFDAETEPKGIAKKAVEFKLNRARNFFEENPEGINDYVVMAADVTFYLNGEQQHKLLRTYSDAVVFSENRGLTKASHIDQLCKLYAEGPFTASWEIAFGVINNGEENIQSLMLVAEFPSLTREEIEERYNPLTNTGIELVELAHELESEIKFTLVDENDNNYHINADLVERIVVKKIPPEELFAQLLHQELEQYPIAAPIALSRLRHIGK